MTVHFIGAGPGDPDLITVRGRDLIKEYVEACRRNGYRDIDRVRVMQPPVGGNFGRGLGLLTFGSAILLFPLVRSECRSPRAARTMITVNMGGLSETLFESELFGHVKGAFTDAKTDRAGRFELADESTLFMDEIANIPLAQQAKLLRVIETGDFERVGSSKTLHANVRIISATNANLENEIAAGRFRQDLLFRLNTIEIELPSLRDRREDIMPLANSFLRQHAERYRKQVGGFDESARERLLQHRFPGNIRELDHIVERAVLMTKDRQIRVADLGLTTGSSESRNVEEMSLEEVEAFLIKKALARNDGNARKAAEALGLSRSAFYRRLQQYGL